MPGSASDQNCDPILELTTDPAQRGPFPVGVLHTQVVAPHDPDRILPTEIWYPAQPGQQETDSAPHPLGMPHRATPGLTPIEGPCSLLAFSHGNSGLRQQSTFLTTHLASWGHVVVAPDHVGNTFEEMLALENEEARQATHRRMRVERPTDIAAVLRALLDDSDTRPDTHVAALRDRLPALDPARLGVLGHSFGGWTTLKLPALEPRIRALCCLAPVSESFVGRKAFAGHELPLPVDIDALVLAARDDVLVDLETSIEPLVERLGPKAVLEIIDGADHFHFCDGIELLHQMHLNNPRPGQLRATRPFSELRGELETQTLLQARVAGFFAMLRT